MTREEMIEQIENTILLIKQNGKDWWDERDIPILEAAIKAMKKEPCEIHLGCTTEEIANSFIEDVEAVKDQLEKQPCQDCVDRQKLIELATSWEKHFTDSERCVSLADIKALPSVTPQPKMGKWIKKIVRGRVELYCSRCRDGIDVIYEYNYCPTCGAKMEESENKE